MHIIHVVLGKANPSRMNGVNRVVNELAGRQHLSGESVCLWGITSKPRHDYPPRPYDTVLFQSRFLLLGLGKELRQAMDDCPADTVFHLHGGFIPLFYLFAKALKVRGLPYVLTAHGSYNTIAMKKSRIRKYWYFQFFERRVLLNALKIHCLGKSEIEGLYRVFANEKTVLIPYGYDAGLAVVPKEQNKDLVIGFCGRLDVYTKGLDLLLTAFSHVANILPGSRLWLIGDGKGRAELENLAQQLKIADRVVFWGSRFDQEKIDLLSQLEIFVHPSRNEGLPTAVLEAASLGIPCVITEATNAGDAVRAFDCGAVIENPESCALFSALMALHKRIHKNGRAHFSENARRMVRQAYNWSGIIYQFHQLYGRA